MSEEYSDLTNFQLIRQILTEDEYSEEAKLKAVKNFKNLFKKTNQSLPNMKLESLLDNFDLFQGNRNITEEFLYSYGMSLVNFLGRNASIDFKIIQQIESVCSKLKEKNKIVLNSLMKNLWERFETTTISYKYLKKFVCMSQNILEDVILGWIEGINDSQNFIKMSASSPELFQAITAILYQVLIKTQGHSTILDLVASYVYSVFSICVREQKDFIKLYPRDCRRLVSLLMIPPEMYPSSDKNEKLVTRDLIGGLLVETIFQNNNKGLLLLSHYPDWLKVAKNYLVENYH